MFYIFDSVRNIFTLTEGQQLRLESYGLKLRSDSTTDATKHLLKKLRPHIDDISDIYSFEQLMQIYDAMFGEAEIIEEGKRERFKQREITSNVIDSNAKRTKIRIDLTYDISYATPLLEHLSRFDNIEIQEIKTGLALKYVNEGYKSNIINFNELRTINGVLHGNLYFNVVRTEEQFESLGIETEPKWFRGFVVLQKICVYDAIMYLDYKNVNILKGLSSLANKRRLKNAKRLIEVT